VRFAENVQELLTNFSMYWQDLYQPLIMTI